MAPPDIRILRQRLLSSSIAGSYLRLHRREDARRAAVRLRPPLFAFGANRFFAGFRLPTAARRVLPEGFTRRAGSAFFLPALFLGAGFFALDTAAFRGTGFC